MGQLTPDTFVVDDLLDFSNDDGQPEEEFETFPDSYTIISPANLPESSNSSSLYADGTGFSDDLCIPSEHIAELEWLSNFVEESSKEEHLVSVFQKPQTTRRAAVPSLGTLLTTGSSFQVKPEPDLEPITDDSDVSVPAKVRTKKSRSAASTWASRLLESAPKKKLPKIKKEDQEEVGRGRRCLHCASEKTPQWRTGPMGPKTLCNACGVRYKSGRLVPEYRPASSPTFVMARHSNSHRKVMELRRQKEMRDDHLLSKLHCENLMMRSNADDFLIHNNNNNNNHNHVVTPDFRHLI